MAKKKNKSKFLSKTEFGQGFLCILGIVLCMGIIFGAWQGMEAGENCLNSASCADSCDELILTGMFVCVVFIALSIVGILLLTFGLLDTWFGFGPLAE